MCGIAGILGPHLTEHPKLAQQMAFALRSRGPDQSGLWTDSRNITLSHARLSIQDTTTAGSQPMLANDGQSAIVFNGEIYNVAVLRDRLTGSWRNLRGKSDTEIFLAHISQYGLEETLQRAAGMFAFGLWDIAAEKLTLVRDRLGEKPLYYCRLARDFVFASDLNALIQHKNWSPTISPDALATYFRFSHVPSPFTIYENVLKLPPGSLLEITTGCRDLPEPKSWWRVSSNRVPGVAGLQSDQDVLSIVHQSLKEVVEQTMLADVPLGAFLSGGIDSSLIVALMQSVSSRPIKTFSIGFEDAAFDESARARQIASALGTDHMERIFGENEIVQFVENLPDVYHEPFADSSQLPTCFVSRLAREQVTVCLTGDGGDELFGGYQKYPYLLRLHGKLRLVPAWARKSIASALRKYITRKSSGISGACDFDLKYQRRELWPEILCAPTAGSMLQSLNSVCHFPHFLSTVGNQLPTKYDEVTDPGQFSPLDSLLKIDCETYLPEDLLVKVDRAAMAVSLETRCPFLDYRIVDTAFSLPAKFNIRGRQNKWILRQLLAKYLPGQLIDPGKRGFGIPLGRWLRGVLKPWADDFLSGSSLDKSGYLNTGLIRQFWNAHLAGKADWSARLWAVLVFQQWYFRTGSR